MKERSNPCFSFTEREKLYDNISHTRFMALVMQPDVDIHEVKEDSNSFGEYFFVTVSCRSEQPQKHYTFWGLGYHEYRERWITDSWQWYVSQQNAVKKPAMQKRKLTPDQRERNVHSGERYYNKTVTPSPTV